MVKAIKCSSGQGTRGKSSPHALAVPASAALGIPLREEAHGALRTRNTTPAALDVAILIHSTLSVVALDCEGSALVWYATCAEARLAVPCWSPYPAHDQLGIDSAIHSHDGGTQVLSTKKLRPSSRRDVGRRSGPAALVFLNLLVPEVSGRIVAARSLQVLDGDASHNQVIARLTGTWNTFSCQGGPLMDVS